MDQSLTDTRTRIDADFRHEALFYEGDEGFVAGVAPFVREGVSRGEAVLVVVSDAKIRMLRDALDGDGDGVFFADMARIGRNPARIIPAWREFINAHRDGGRRVRGVGEPIWAARSPAELVECQRHESLLNVAFAGSGPWSLLCPYDTSSLGKPVLEEAGRSHPFLVEQVRRQPSAAFRAEQMAGSHLTDPLTEPARCLEDLIVGVNNLGSLRSVVESRSKQFGLEQGRVHDLTLAVHEIASNSVFHGGGAGSFRLWRDARSLVCELRDSGSIESPLVGREHPDVESSGGRGVWLANQLCDLVQIRSFPTGSVVRLHMSLHDG